MPPLPQILATPLVIVFTSCSYSSSYASFMWLPARSTASSRSNYCSETARQRRRHCILLIHWFLQSFDAVGWAAGRASGLLKKLNGGVLAWLSVWNEVQTCTRPSWCHCHSLSLASVKSWLDLPFWYRLTRVVVDKGPLNGCVCDLLINCSVLIHSAV